MRGKQGYYVSDNTSLITSEATKFAVQIVKNKSFYNCSKESIRNNFQGLYTVASVSLGRLEPELVTVAKLPSSPDWTSKQYSEFNKLDRTIYVYCICGTENLIKTMIYCIKIGYSTY